VLGDSKKIALGPVPAPILPYMSCQNLHHEGKGSLYNCFKYVLPGSILISNRKNLNL
jgi:hypothetical protein